MLINKTQMIRNLNKNEYNQWLKIAAEVEDLFGPMVDSEEFQNGIRECIKNNVAFCSADNAGNIIGIIAIDRENSEITWLAVCRKFRGNNAAQGLVDKAIQELEKNRDIGYIYVQTFASEIEAGKAARHLYEKNGFTDLKDSGKNPAGIETVIMVRK